MSSEWLAHVHGNPLAQNKNQLAARFLEAENIIADPCLRPATRYLSELTYAAEIFQRRP
jgi:hypothetical protein